MDHPSYHLSHIIWLINEVARTILEVFSIRSSRFRAEVIMTRDRALSFDKLVKLGNHQYKEVYTLQR